MIAPRGRVYAVERDPEQLQMIRQNLVKFDIGNVEIVHGEAPDALDGLPAPDAVFLGGSGGRLLGILAAVCLRLKDGGRIVVNAATIETAVTAISDLRERGFEPKCL